MTTEKPIVNVVSMSGGKDSLATALVCLETQPRESIRLVFADTGNEHPITIDYLEYLERKLDKTIDTVKADFRADMLRKRDRILVQWPQQGIPDEVTAAAAELLSESTGIPFLDLCMLKGMFPPRRSKFCTTNLKVFPLTEYQMDIAETGAWVWSWLGVRADESLARRYLPEWNDLGGGIGQYRPILRWTALDAMEAAHVKGIKPNPLYSQGMTRVGCMPCIYSRKSEVTEIARRWPWVIDKIRSWEKTVGDAAVKRYATFFLPQARGRKMTAAEFYHAANIDAKVRWAMTAYGGKQYDLIKAADVEQCTSAYGLCE